MKEKAEVQEFATSCMSCGVISDMRALWTSASNGPWTVTDNYAKSGKMKDAQATNRPVTTPVFPPDQQMISNRAKATQS